MFVLVLHILYGFDICNTNTNCQNCTKLNQTPLDPVLSQPCCRGNTQQ